MSFRDRWAQIWNERGDINFGGSKTDTASRGTSTIVLPTPSKEEQELQKLNLELVKKQLAQFDQMDVEQKAFAASPRAALQSEISDLALKNLKGRLTGEAILPPAAEARLNEVFRAAESEGSESIRRFAEESAASRGLRLADSPIANEALRTTRKFQEQLRGTKAQAALNLGEAESSFAQTLATFQEQLRQQAFQNRLSLVGMTPPSFGLQQQYFGERAAAPSQTFRQSGDISTFQWGVQGGPNADLRSIGSLMGGGGGAMGAGALAASSARLKRDITPLDPDEYDRALDRVRETPIVRYRYRWEDDRDRAPHIGPILELSPVEIREDDTRVNLLDYTGLMHASVKALDRKVEAFRATLARRAR